VLEDNWIVMTKDDASDELITAMCEGSTCKACKDVGHPSEGGVSFFGVQCSEAGLEEMILQGDGIVDSVEPDLPVSLPELEMESEESQEESLAATWGLNKIGADKGPNWGLNRIGANRRPNRGKGVSIYILDTGVRTSHSEFGGRASTALDYTSPLYGKRKKCKGKKNCAVDNLGHGTHCAGIAAGESHGVAPQAKIFSAKVLSDRGFGSSSMTIGALDWIVSKVRKHKGPTVASMSLGGKGTSNSMEKAIRKVTRGGVVVVVAAGNDETNACGFSPAFVGAAITVGSMDWHDDMSSFSNYGKCVDIWAPGSNILSADHTSNNAFRYKDGTSMACPYVSGAAAVVLSISPDAPPSLVKRKLLKVARKGHIHNLKNSDNNRLLFVGFGR